MFYFITREEKKGRGVYNLFSSLGLYPGLDAGSHPEMGEYKGVKLPEET